MEKIVIIGGGPCGLGAAWRLQELKHGNFKLFERSSDVGGLAKSLIDKKGFTWDIGGHVLFSHYDYFNRLMNKLLTKDEWIFHRREAWVWLKNRLIPYPFQNNIKYLDKENRDRCLNGLIKARKEKSHPRNFKEWIFATFGQGIAELFLIPYNAKIWAYPLEKMSFSWIGERISTIDLKRIKNNIYFDRADTSWGPNNIFRFPVKGGTGEIWKRIINNLSKDNYFLDHEVTEIDIKNNSIKFSNGNIEKYDSLISTLPLDKLIKISGLSDGIRLDNLMYSSVHIIGIGLKSKLPKFLRKKCWIYFSEQAKPFYRATIFSNYSPNNVPDIKKYWSIILEVSESKFKKINLSALKNEIINSLIDMRFVSSHEEIVDYWYHRESYGYPTPTVDRDKMLEILKILDKQNIYSRGRFGAWKYEVANMDHAFMQGVELIDRLLLNKEEKTVWHPEFINK